MHWRYDRYDLYTLSLCCGSLQLRLRTGLHSANQPGTLVNKTFCLATMRPRVPFRCQKPACTVFRVPYSKKNQSILCYQIPASKSEAIWVPPS
jgi:hypothetical protein